MFSSTILIVPLVIAASAIARPTNPFVARATSDVRLSEWAAHSPALESYWTFKNRFRALDCASQQGTDFYTSCCYPLDATQSLSDRPAECTPASTSCGASVQAVTSSSSSSSSSAAPAYTEASTGSTNNNNDNNGYVDDDDENLPVCEDPNDDGEWHDDEYDDDAYSFSSQSTPTTSSYTPDPTSSDAPQSTADPNSGNNGNTGGSNTGETYTGGWATYFWQGGNPGACGNYHGDNDLIAALDTRMYGTDYSQPSSWCGRSVRVTNTQNGKTVDVIIQDACPSCVSSTSLDLSHGAFLAIAEESQGTVPITWTPLY